MKASNVSVNDVSDLTLFQVDVALLVKHARQNSVCILLSVIIFCAEFRTVFVYIFFAIHKAKPHALEVKPLEF